MRRRVVLLSACALLLTSCTNEMVGSATMLLTDVTWTNAVNVIVSGNSLTKSGSLGWNAGASSNETLVGDGYVEFTTGENTTHKMAGLSGADTDQSYGDIDFAFYLRADGKMRIYESGTLKAYLGTYSPGDTFRIENSGGVIRYFRNGILVYVSSASPAASLVFDTSLATDGATINNVVMQNLSGAFWQNEVNVITSANDIRKAGGTGWNAGGSSVATINGDGYVEFTTAENNTNKMAGLSNGDTDQGFADIDFALYLRSDGKMRVFESGAVVAYLGAYSAGDVFRVENSGGIIRYYQNGVLLYTSSATPTLPLLLDTSLSDNGATINSATLVEEAFWQNEVGVSASGNDLVKTGTNGWNAGASSVQTLSADGYFEFTSSESDTYKMAGLNDADIDQSYTELDYAWYLRADGTLRIYESGTVRGNFGSYAPGDVFRIERSGSTVYYYMNGALEYTSAVSSSGALVADTSLNTTGATITAVSLTNL